MNGEKEIRKKAFSFVLSLFVKDLSKNLLYHSFSHTEETLKACKRIAEEEDVDSTDRDLLFLAALFHDTGYTISYEDHEKHSVEIARNWLLEQNVDEEKIARICSLIMSTRSGHVPENRLEEILHDADYWNIGKRSFQEKSSLLRREWELVLNRVYTELEWEKMQLEFLGAHRFYTRYGQRKLEPGKAANALAVQEKIVKLENKETEKSVPKTSRGVETMYRSIYRNHIGLSAIADRKANMMISINTIIISVIMSFIGSGFTFMRQQSFEHMRFTLPLVLLLVTSMISVTFAILSARPNLHEKKEDSKESMLFFGTFAGMKVNAFVSGMQNLLNAPAELYDNMSVDIYNLGAVLQRKYSLLRVSYSSFLAGLVVTVISFLLILGYSYQSGITK